MRTFVFISNIPDFLLQPIYKNEGKGSAGDASSKKPVTNSKFDLRYERLRRLLVEHSSGVMLVMHLETRGYALALYASEGEALAACKADIAPEQPGQSHRPLRLRIVTKERPRPPEPVYNPFLIIEGEEVRKTDLADTRGLELVYRGRAVAKWCHRTQAGEDCLFGVSCLRLHRAAVQRTVRKRPRIEEEDAASRLSPVQHHTVRRLLASVKDAREALAPPSLAMPGCLYVPVSQAEIEAVCGVSSQAAVAINDDDDDAAAAPEAARQAVAQRVDAALQAAVTPPHAALSSPTVASPFRTAAAFFPRLSCPGGAPWEWSVESEEGRRVLRNICPLPANGAPTPLERDLYTQKLWYHMNQLNRCHDPTDVLRMLRCSRRVREAVRLQGQPSVEVSDALAPNQRATTTNSTGSLAPGPGAAPLFICLEPWLYLPTVGCEVTAFVERGGRRVRGVVQRYGQVRLMTSAALLRALITATRPSDVAVKDNDEADNRALTSATASVVVGEEKSNAAAMRSDVGALLSRYAVLDAHADPEAEEALSSELRCFQRSIATAVGDLVEHLQRSAEATGGAGAAWCAHLAVVLPASSLPSTALPNTTHSGSSPSVKTAAVPPRPPPVVLLSCRPYHRALEECSLYSALAPPTSSSTDDDATEVVARPSKVEVIWNTQRHPYIPLFSRDVLEKLRVGGAQQ